MKKGARHLFLLVVFIAAHFCARAQQVFPKWVGDLDNDATGYCSPTNMAIDKQNNIYVTGIFTGTVDFDPSTGVKNLSTSGTNVFLGKYKSDGTLLWVETLAGEPGSSVLAHSLAVDKDGNISVIGTLNTDTTDVDPGPGVYNLINKSLSHVFVLHLDASGNFLWARSIGSGNATGVAADSHDNVVITGFSTTQMTIGDSTYTPPLNGGYGLIIKYSFAGDLVWSIAINNKQNNQSQSTFGCKVDGNDNILVDGTFGFSSGGAVPGTVNFNPLGTAYNLTAGSKNGAYFLAKYSPVGVLHWVNAINTPNIAMISRIGIDLGNNVYFGATYQDSVTFGNSTALHASSYQHVCVAKYSSAGIVQFAKSTQGTATTNTGVSDMAIDNSGNIYITGDFSGGSVNFNPNQGTPENVSGHGRFDLYVAKYDSNGSGVYAFGLGSPNCFDTQGLAIAIDNNSNVNIGGTFCSTINFDPSGCSPVSLTSTSGVGADGFLAQYSSAGLTNNIITPPTITGFCTSGTPAAITGSTPSGGTGVYAYQWQSSADSLNFTNIPGAVSINYTPPLLTATTFYQRIVSANCSTPSTGNVVALRISSPPGAPQAVGDTSCAGATATLSITSPQAGLTYKWYATAAGDTSLFTGISFTTPPLSATTTYYAEADNTGCSSATRTAATVTILPLLAAPVVTAGPITGTSVTFEWAAVPGATGYQISVDSGKTFSRPSSGAGGLMTTVSGLQPGDSVSIIVQAIGTVPCQLSAGSAAISATIPKNDVIYVPNAFTPNGDGKNDQVHVHGKTMQGFKFYIYDQWGELLFTSSDVQNGWDGTYKGKKEPAGVYIYYLQATLNDGRSINKKGTITLIR